VTRVQLAIMAGLRRLGDPYLMRGLEGKPLLTGRRETDCSGFMQVIVAEAGIERITMGVRSIGIRSWAGSVIQFNWCREIPVSAALGRDGIGTFLFSKPRGSIAGHVALSLGHGYTLEARGSEGVCIVRPETNAKRKWDRAAKLPKLFEKIAAEGGDE